MADQYSGECPDLEETDSTNALPPSRLLADAATDPMSAGSAMYGFEPAAGPASGLPDAFQGLVAPRPGERDPLAEALGDAHALLRGVTENLRAGISVHLDVVAQVLGEKHGACAGQCDLICDQVEQCIAKRNSKIDQALIHNLAHCYNLLARFGVVPPSSEELMARVGQDGRLGPPAPAAAQLPGGPAETQTPQQQALQRLPAVQPAYPQQLQGLPAQPIYPPRPTYRKGDDCCHWWVVWWEWFTGAFWVWWHEWTRHGCIPIHICRDPRDDLPTAPILFAVAGVDPIQPLVAMMEVETGRDDLTIQG